MYTESETGTSTSKTNSNDYREYLKSVPMELMQEQYMNEMGMRNAGSIRFQKHVDRMRRTKSEDSTSYGNRLLTQLIQPVADDITAWVASSRIKAGRLHSAVPYLELFDDKRVVALIALKAILSQLCNDYTRLSSTAMQISAMLQDEYDCRELRAVDRQAYNGIKKAVADKGDYKRKQWTARYIMTKKEHRVRQDWAPNNALRVGLLLVERVNHVVGLLEVHDRRERGKTHKCIRPTELARQWITENVEAMRYMSPMLEPTVVRPKPWVTGEMEGGYYTDYIPKLSFVKTRSRRYLEDVKYADMPVLLNAVNAAQDTAWRINVPVLELIEELFQRDSELGEVPRANPYTLPAKPDDIAENPEARKIYRAAARKVYEANVALSSRRMTYIITLGVARRYARYSNIYMPANLDFRGRLYFLPMINPQGADYSKAMLHFSEGKPIGDEGIPWLKVHVANLFGVDKVPFAERIQWVDDNMTELRKTAADPFNNRLWSTADKPFQAYAACLELKGVYENGAAHVTHLPIALDGSCSGIQNLSLAFRDEVGGAAVNLIPCDTPADIYQTIADKSVASLKLTVASGDEDAPYAAWWLDFGVTRKSCKRNCMTYPYGSGQFGFGDQILEDTIMPWIKSGGVLPEGWKSNKLAQVLAKANYQSVCATVVKASEAMAWMQKAARMVAAEGHPVHWNTPLGFPVIQNYRQEREIKVETALAGERMTLSVRRESLKVDRRKSANAISPNVVHSLDSSHLMLVVDNALKEGMSSFALIHDSFGVHACDTGRFYGIIRESFIDLYEDDVFKDLHDQLVQQVSPDKRKDFPAIPSSGSLDPENILDSLYCFA